MRSLLVTFLVLSLVLTVPVPAQQAQAPASEQTPTFTAGAEEVILDVVVRDKKGKPIKDLSTADFKVTDDGKEQKINAVRLVEGMEAIQNGSKVPLDALRQVRLVTLVFDGMGEDQRRIARQAAENLVNGDQATNVFYSVTAITDRLIVLQGFTRDKALLKKGIELALSGKYQSFVAESERVKSSLRDVANRAAAASSAAGDVAGPGGGLGAAALERRTAQIMLDMAQYDASSSENDRSKIFSLLSLIRGQYSMPGRKSIVYFSWGMYVPTHLDEPFRAIASSANRGNVTLYPVDCKGVTTWSQNSGAAEALRSANRDIADDTTSDESRVSKGQVMASDRAEQAGRSNISLPLRTLAEDTGGFLIGETNDLRPSLKQVNEEVASYYEISYNPGIGTYDGKFRATKVELARKDTVLHARKGYFALPVNLRGPAVMPYEFALMKAFETNPAPHDVDFRAGAMKIKPGKDGAKSIVVVEVPMSGIKFTEDPAAKTFKMRVSLVSLLRDEKGEIAGKLSYDLPRQGALNLVQQAKAGNFIYKEQMMVAPGKYTLETAVMDHEANKMGVLKSPFVVDAKPSGVAISNLCLVRNYQANVKDLPADEPLQFQGGRITPTLSGRVFAAPGAQLSTFFVVHPDSAISGPATASIEFLVDGQVIAKSDLPLPAPDAQGKIPFVMSVPAENMPPADYEIHITAKQGNSSAEEKMKVTIAARQ
jgi:VWFA-related protein